VTAAVLAKHNIKTASSFSVATPAPVAAVPQKAAQTDSSADDKAS
jgi:hypothetical protein